MTTGVRNCTPRARLNADPMAVFRISVGNNSENRGPYPPNMPVPNPTRNMKTSIIPGYAAMGPQKSVTIARPSARITA